MKVLLQRVHGARVEVEGQVVGAVEGPGILLFAGVEHGDDEPAVERLARRALGYRVFPDGDGRMNRSVTDVGGGVLAVSQFTLAADTRKGMRPSFSSAAPPEAGRHLFDHFLSCLRGSGLHVATGKFAADMQVHLVNDGPVTFLL